MHQYLLLYDHTPMGNMWVPDRRTHTKLDGNAGLQMRMLLYWQIQWNKQHVITSKDMFLRVEKVKQLSQMWLRMYNLLQPALAEQQCEWEATEREKEKEPKISMSLTFMCPPPPLHQPCSSVALINAVYPGLWRPLDNGPVICSCSFLSQLRATIIVLSVWTGEISVRCLV